MDIRCLFVENFTSIDEKLLPVLLHKSLIRIQECCLKAIFQEGLLNDMKQYKDKQQKLGKSLETENIQLG